MPKVTVAMPVYNAEEFIHGAVTNICNQSLSDFEIIISDNASTDGTYAIVEEMAREDSRIKLYRQPFNKGVFANFMFVAEKASSDYVVLAAHDDEWSLNYLESLLDKALEMPTAEIIVPSVKLKNIDGSVHRDLPIDEKVFLKKGLRRVQGLLKAATGSWFYGMFKRASLLKALKNAQDYNYIWGIDFIAFTPYLLNGRVAASKEAVFVHVNTGSSYDKYRPITAEERWSVYKAFARKMNQYLRESSLSPLEKLWLIPSITIYTGYHSCKFRRVVRTFLLPRKEEKISTQRNLKIS